MFDGLTIRLFALRCAATDNEWVGSLFVVQIRGGIHSCILSIVGLRLLESIGWMSIEELSGLYFTIELKYLINVHGP